MTLRDRLLERIHARGPITFADFMDAALYDPQDGYYTTHAAIGFDGADFLTSPELGPAFGRALSRAAIDCWSGIGKPAQWDLVEAGAGRGILMRDLLDALGKERPEAARTMTWTGKASSTSFAKTMPRMGARERATDAQRSSRPSSARAC